MSSAWPFSYLDKGTSTEISDEGAFVSVSYHCVTNYPKLSGLKQKSLIIIPYLSLGWLGVGGLRLGSNMNQGSNEFTELTSVSRSLFGGGVAHGMQGKGGLWREEFRRSCQEEFRSRSVRFWVQGVHRRGWAVGWGRETGARGPRQRRERGG